MIRPESVAKVLAQTNTGGIKCTLLFNKDGTLVCSSGIWKGEDPSVSASAVSGIWSTYEKARRGHPGAGSAIGTGTKAPKLECVVLEHDNGILGLARIEGTSTLVCCLADPTEEIGLIRKKVITIADCLKESVQ